MTNLLVTIALAWAYPPEDVTNITFRIYHTTEVNKPLTNWVHIATTTATNINLPVNKGPNFFAVTASNFWGESFFSNVASTPPLVHTNTPVSIQR